MNELKLISKDIKINLKKLNIEKKKSFIKGKYFLAEVVINFTYVEFLNTRNQ